jgi:hypothetical protein
MLAMTNNKYEWKPEFNEWIKQFGIRLKPSHEESQRNIEQMNQMRIEPSREAERVE